MTRVEQVSVASNNLLELQNRAVRKAVLAECESVDLPLNHTIVCANDVIADVYFPITAYVSLITLKGAAESLEVGMVGNEGMIGVPLLLGIKTTPLTALVQGAGSALRMSAATFERLLERHPSFRRTLNQYFYFLTEQIAQTAACNRYHTLEARMERWLLMTADRAHGPLFSLTHRFLAYMLGVRRAGVTEAAGELQARKLIHYSRGRLMVTNRKGLEEHACACYSELKVMYGKSVGMAKSAKSGNGGWSVS